MTQKPSKGQLTRSHILRTAGQLFSEKSFDTVSLRAIARAAGVDPALINHYFGSKEGLFEALIVATMRPSKIGETLQKSAPEQRGEALVRYADELWSSPTGQGLIAVIKRALTGNTEHVEMVFQRTLAPQLAATMTCPKEEQQVRVALIGTQLNGLLLLRHVLKFSALAELSTEAVAATVGPTIQRYLDGPLH